VRVRVVSANGLDLSLFQYDTDQSFAVFLLNGDGTIYGRYGTRSDQTHWVNDVSIEGLAKALEGALDLHREYPQNAAALAKKKGPPPEFPAPEKYPRLSGRYGSQLNYDGNVVQSCIHCHQIGDAQRQLYREKNGAIPEQILFPYPHPKALGLILDPKERATVLRVESGSLAEKAGFQAGDVITHLDQQQLLSMADVQWVLHHVPAAGGRVVATLSRGGQSRPITLELPQGWRQLDDISWRVSSWELRRMGLGGMFVKPLDDDARKELKLPAGAMAFKVQHTGQFPPHDVAKKAGVKNGDILIAFDGRTDLVRETDLLAYAVNQVPPGRAVPVKLLRDGASVTLSVATGR
jgi:hypothetical protein